VNNLKYILIILVLFLFVTGCSQPAIIDNGTTQPDTINEEEIIEEIIPELVNYNETINIGDMI